MSTAIETRRPSECLPVMSIQEARSRFQQMAEFVRSVMRDGTDYGQIPGTNTKPVLLKPGAEKLCSLFGLVIPDPVILSEIEDWTGERHGGEPFFYYKVLQRLSRGGEVVASQFGSCNSRESKYRWRAGERKCPACGAGAIIKGKQDYGGGYLCFGKKGGCGAKFSDKDPAITGQSVARVPNPDIADLVNTIQKMAEKRALVASVLLAVNASEFFTQDLDDLADSDVAPVVVEVVSAPESRRIAQRPAAQPAQVRTEEPAPVSKVANREARTPPQQDDRQQEAEERFPVAAPQPTVMFARLLEKDAALAKEGLCEPGGLIEHLRAAGEESGYMEVELWAGEKLRAFAKEETAKFEAGARKELAARQKAATAKAPANGTATASKQPASTAKPNPAQIDVLANACGQKGIHWREICKMMAISRETDIATIDSPTWQKAMAILLKMPETQKAPGKQDAPVPEDAEMSIA